MKIKEVCEQTELTARTIRFYIEEKLILPEYSENYLGRKTYNFSAGDVKNLLNIATLRKYGFSITEIRLIVEDKNNSTSVINDICNRKAKTIQDEKEMFVALSQLNDGGLYSIEEIAGALNSCREKRNLPKDDTMSAILLLLKNPKQLLKKSLNIADKLLLLISFGVSVFFIVFYFSKWKYPHIYDVRLGLLLLFLTSIPALIIFSIWLAAKIIAKKTSKRKTIPGIGFVSSILVFLSFIPIGVIGVLSPVQSLTTDMQNYRKIDEYIYSVYNNNFYNMLFPLTPKSAIIENHKLIYPDSDYYYRCKKGFADTTDIYAEWSLKKADFDKEIDRVKKLYFAYEFLDNDESDCKHMKYTEIQKGNYTCLMRYVRYDGGKPFTEEKGNYFYFIFAYDEDALRVRYILCYSDTHGSDQPYYLELDW